MTLTNPTLAGALVALTLVCSTVLAALHVLPEVVIEHVVSVTLGGALGYLIPKGAT